MMFKFLKRKSPDSALKTKSELYFKTFKKLTAQ